MGLLVCSDSIAKLMGQTYTASQVFFLRSLMIAILISCVLLWTGDFRRFRSVLHAPNLLRAFFDSTAAALFLFSLMHLPLSVLSSIVLTVPLMVTALSFVFLGDRVGWRRWAAVLTGFAGAILIVRPSHSSFDVWAMTAVACAMLTSCRDIVTRRIASTTPSLLVTFSSATACILLGGLLCATETWRPFTNRDIAMLAGGAVFHCAGMFAIVIALRSAPPSVTAPFRYTLLIFAAVAGYVVFGEVPDGYTILGAALIAGSGLYALHRERLQSRERLAGIADPKPGPAP